MTKLDGVLKGRGITLLTKVHIVKAMVFPVVKCGCDSWNIRKAVTDLDSVLKSRDTTLLTKVHIVKAMAFPVVMYGCESWTMKKAEH